MNKTLIFIIKIKAATAVENNVTENKVKHLNPVKAWFQPDMKVGSLGGHRKKPTEGHFSRFLS